MENDRLNKIIINLRNDTHESQGITYRNLRVCHRNIYVIYDDALTSSDKISDFIIRSLDDINHHYSKFCKLDDVIMRSINNVSIKRIYSYKEICYYLHYGFTILLIEDCSSFLVLETKRNLSRSITSPQTETALRGAMDSFVEDILTNVGLIRRRIKDNRLWIDSHEVGRYTKTLVNVFYIKGLCHNSVVLDINRKIDNIDIDGILSSGWIKNLIERENKSVFPTIFSTERPDKVCQALLSGKVVIMCDCSQFALILPVVMNDLFISTEDGFNKSINISITRIIRYISFFITLLTPSIYLALTTFHQDMLPTPLLIGFATQRFNVPFPTFVEAVIMMVAFEILRECDLRSPTFTTSALSTVGALILGDAAVSAGIVSPIMIIVVAITSLSALIFTEPEMTNGLRWYRLFFMFGATAMGMVGILLVFMYMIIKLCALESFGVPYFVPFSPLSVTGLKNSIIKFPALDLNKRSRYFSDNVIKYRDLSSKERN